MSNELAVQVADLRMRLGRVGLHSSALWSAPAEECRAAARRAEELNYGSLWQGELVGGKDVFVNVCLLLGVTSKIIIGTGIANIWARAPATAQGAAAGLAAAFPGRFINGLGVSHPFAAQAGGQTYGKPLERMRDYIVNMDASLTGSAWELGEEAFTPVPRLIGAVGPKMTALARDLTAGAMPRFMTPAYNRVLRDVLGEDRLLIPEQAVVLETDPAKARAIARRFTGFYVGLPNYQKLLKLMGFTDADYQNGGSDRLVDSIVAWGDAETIAGRVNEHLDAGADHVLVHPQGDGFGNFLRHIEALAPVLVQ